MNIKHSLFSLVLASTALSLSATSLAETKPVGSGPNPYVNCGIGAALFPTTHWAAVTSNIIWDLGTTAVTSATSSPETCNKRNVEVAQFILDTYDNLAEETAQGEGEHLSAMLEILDCQQGIRPSVVSAVRREMGQQIGVAGYSDQSQIEKAAIYYDVVNAAAANCAA
jgi:predicted Zn-dependent protease